MDRRARGGGIGSTMDSTCLPQHQLFASRETRSILSLSHNLQSRVLNPHDCFSLRRATKIPRSWFGATGARRLRNSNSLAKRSLTNSPQVTSRSSHRLQHTTTTTHPRISSPYHTAKGFHHRPRVAWQCRIPSTIRGDDLLEQQAVHHNTQEVSLLTCSLAG